MCVGGGGGGGGGGCDVQYILMYHDIRSVLISKAGDPIQ